MSHEDRVSVASPQAPRTDATRGLARRLGLFDSTMIVMGGIVGSGIFINPYVVARQVHTPALILGAWALGGLIALGGAFAYAELAALRPEVGGQYAYLREAYHPAGRNGRRRRHLRALLPRARALARCTVGGRDARDSRTDARQLLRRAGRRCHPERADGHEDRGHRCAGRLRLAADSPCSCRTRRHPRPAALTRLRDCDGRGHGTRAVRLRWMADGELRRGRNARAGEEPAARTPAWRAGGHHPIPRGQLRFRASASTRGSGEYHDSRLPGDASRAR